MKQLGVIPRDEQSIRPRFSSRSAVVLLPPRESWEAMDAIREKHDRQIVRWMPHIKLLFPFKNPDDLDDLLPELSDLCARHDPFEATLSEVGYSGLESGRAALWVGMEPVEPAAELNRDLVDRFPETLRLTEAPEPFAPRLGLGEARTRRSGARIAGEIGEAWEPVSFRVASVAVVGRGYSGPFQVLAEIPLGG